MFRVYGADIRRYPGFQPNCANPTPHSVIPRSSTQGRYSEVENLLRQALEIEQKTLGLNHPELANTLHDLAGVLMLQVMHSTDIMLGRIKFWAVFSKLFWAYCSLERQAPRNVYSRETRKGSLRLDVARGPLTHLRCFICKHIGQTTATTGAHETLSMVILPKNDNH